MRISVIVCAHNESRYISCCLHSLLAQIRRPDELLVVDNASLFSVTSLKHYPYVANSDFHKAKHLYSWKTLLRCDTTWPAVKAALRKNVDIALTLYRNGEWSG